jgi:hypothetical protein
MTRGHAIFAIDPGGKTGVAWGFFNAEADSVGSAIKRARKKSSIKAYELAGPTWAQGIVLGQTYKDFFFRCNVELAMDVADIHLVIEDFQLRQKNVDLAPVEVTNSFIAAIAGTDGGEAESVKKTDDIGTRVVCTDQYSWPYGRPIYQQPSTAMTYATNARLRDWDAWVRGSEHMRDAMRHLAAKLSDLLD